MGYQNLFQVVREKEKPWVWNPKTRGSGIITCIPQKGECPNHCDDCFFQSGRSYLKPLAENLPHIPSVELSEHRIVRMNDGNDSNVERELVENTAQKYRDYFFNTAIPTEINNFSGPVVLTVNPADMTDEKFYVTSDLYESTKERDDPPDNLMYVRIRVNTWNLNDVVIPAVKHYTSRGVAVVLTFMAYYTETIPELHKEKYSWKKRTLNSYWVLNLDEQDKIMNMFKMNPLVYPCGVKGQHACSYCGNCIREYFNCTERMRVNNERKPYEEE